MTKWQSTLLREYVREVGTRRRDTPAEILSVTNNGFVRSREVFDKQIFSEDVSNYKLVQFGDLAYNPTRINVGSIALCTFEDGGAVSPMYVVFRCNEGLSPEFLLDYLKSEFGRQSIAHHSVGGVRPMLRFSDLCQIEIPLPSSEEQERVVRLFRDVRTLQDLRDRADGKMRELSQSLFDHYFGEPTKSNRPGPISSVGNELALIEYGPRFYNEAYSNTGPRIVRITDIDPDGNLNFDTMPRYEVEESVLTARELRPGDIIFARSGATVGKVALIPDDAPSCIAGAYFIRMHFKEHVLPRYALGYFQSRGIQQIIAMQSKQAAQPNFSGPLIRALPLPVPPVDVQLDFTNQMLRLTTVREFQVSCRESVGALGPSLAQWAFQEM
jgi:type I restriction enzyme, S subunit